MLRWPVFIAVLLLSLNVAYALPLHGQYMIPRFANDNGNGRIRNEFVSGQIIYSIVSLSSVGLLSSMLATRIRTLSLNQWKSLNCLRLLIIANYAMGISFVFSSAVIQNGSGLATSALCHTGILICLVFYFGSKVILYMFFVERAYTIKSFEIKRFQSWVWRLGMLGIAVGFVPIGIAAFLNPIHDISPIDGLCRIGLPLKITVPLLVYDVLINVTLTGVFNWLVRQFLPNGLLPASPRWVQKLAVQIHFSDPGDFQHMEQVAAIERVVLKSFIGAVAIAIPTIANLALLYTIQGREQSWLCFTMCTIDVTWSAVVLQWLTVNPTEFDSPITGETMSRLPSAQSTNYHDGL